MNRVEQIHGKMEERVGNTMEIEGAVRRWRMSMTSLAGSGRGDAAFAGRKMGRLTEDAGL